MDLTVTHAPTARRYEAREGDQLVALAEYVPADGLLVLTHTEVLDGHGGRGVASRLIAGALDDVRARGLEVVPVCPFASRFIARHREEYGDLVHRSRTREMADGD